MFRRVLVALVPLAFLAPAARVAADPLPESSERLVDYDLAVRLDPESKSIAGRGRVTWRNPSSDEVPDLCFHLYLNAFRNNRSTFFRESGGRLRRSHHESDGWGWIELTALRLADGTDLLPGLEFVVADEGSPDDRTVARVALPEAVPPDGEIAVDLEFEARLPRVYARTGWAPGDFFLVGQWFPKLAVYEPAGLRGRAEGGWNAHSFHADSEFYADFGTYRVEVTAPSRYVVGATGVEVDEHEGPDGTTVRTFEQGDVHDFVWTADPSFVEIVETFSASEDVSPGRYEETARRLDRTLEDVRLSDVEIRLLVQPEHQSQTGRYLGAAKTALREMGLAYGRYPYPTLTIVDPPAEASGAGGMEYPTFVTGGTRYAIGLPLADRVPLPEVVTVHEIGHQFWQGLAASNEFEESWLDEGFTSYAASRALAVHLAGRPPVVPGLRIDSDRFARVSLRPDDRFDAMRTAAWRFSSHRAYRFNSYDKPELFLGTLERLLGETTMARVMRTYAERWRFRHPGSDDFRAVAEEVSGRDLGAVFDAFVESPGIFDPAVVDVRTTREPAPRGRIDRDDGPVVISDADADAEEGAEDARPWRSRVELRHLGDLRLPVEVELRFEGREPVRRTWDASERWASWELVEPERLLAVEIDPDGIWRLDARRLNNRLSTEDDPRAHVELSRRVLGFVQRLLAAAAL